MNLALVFKLCGGLVTAAGIGTGGYFLSNHFSKSKEEKEKTKPEKPSTDGTVVTPPAKPPSPQGTSPVQTGTNSPAAVPPKVDTGAPSTTGSPAAKVAPGSK